MPQLATLRKAPTVASRSPNGGLLLHCAKQTQACIRAVYTGSAFESQWADATCTFSGKLLATKRRGLKEKRAGPSHKPHPKATCPHPTRPLRPPGRRARDDYAQVEFKMQPQVEKKFRIFRAQTITKIATLEKILSLLKFTLPQPQQQTRYCEVIQPPDRRLFL